MANPELVIGFDINDTNTTPVTPAKQTDGFLFGETVSSAVHNELFKQLFAAANKNKNDGVWEWEDPTIVDPTTEYNTGSMVSYLGEVYISLVDTNIVTPTNDLTNWVNITASVLLAEFEVTGAAVTSVDFTGLDINVHKSYRIEIELNNPTGSSSLIYCFANNDTTITNYNRQLLQVSGAVVTASRTNDASIITNGANQKQSSAINIILSNQAFSATALNQRAIDGVASNVSEYITLGKTTLQANITQLTFTASVANTIGIGSKIRIYRGDV